MHSWVVIYTTATTKALDNPSSNIMLAMQGPRGGNHIEYITKGEALELIERLKEVTK